MTEKNNYGKTLTKHVSRKNDFTIVNFRILKGLRRLKKKKKKKKIRNYLPFLNYWGAYFHDSKYFFQLILICVADSHTGPCSAFFFQKYQLNLFFYLDCPFRWLALLPKIGTLWFLYHNSQFRLPIPPSLPLILL